MEITQHFFGSSRGGRFFRLTLLIAFFLVSGANLTSAQESDTQKDSAATEATAVSEESGPSLENLSKNLSAQTDAIAKMKEKERHDQIMSYIYMGVGFSIVIAIAWFTTALARKRQKQDDEKKAIRLANMKHKPHHGHRR